MTQAETIADGVTLYPGDCLDVLGTLADNTVDSCVTDPPYHLTSIVKRFGAENAAPAKVGKTGAYARASAGFMGKKWDGGDIAFREEAWVQVLRVLKPGGHLLAFSGTRTYHNMAVAIERAGFEIRDQIGWCYGSGFPKSHNVGDGWGTALKPAWEPIVVARKPLEGTVAANVMKWGTGAINVDGCRVATDEALQMGKTGLASEKFFTKGVTPQIEKHQHALGRWPANIIHDGSEEVTAAFPESDGAQGVVKGNEASTPASNVYGAYKRQPSKLPRGDSGSAARFFYTAKADHDDRLGSKHPTVKPVDLIQYLVRLVTPKGGLCLDPFAGTGTLGEACIREGMRAILIERETEYQDDIRRRMKLAMAGPDERARESMKARNPNPDLGPLFAEFER